MTALPGRTQSLLAEMDHLPEGWSDDPSVRWPWPYSAEELRAIAATLPGGRDDLLREVVLSARIVLGGLFVAHGDGDGVRSLVTLARCIDDITQQLEGCFRTLPVGAYAFLSVRPEVGESVVCALEALHRARYALPIIASPPRGPAPNIAKPWMIDRLHELFAQAHPDGKRPPGRPLFVKRCLAPLGIDTSNDRRSVHRFKAKIVARSA